MSASFSPEKEVPTEDTVMLNVLLNCEETKSSETKQVHFQSLPTTPLEIKKKIEEDFSIPSCVQTLRYQSMILKDSDQLQHTHFRSGDTFSVDYPIKGECEMMKNVIKWLKELFELFQSLEECSLAPDEAISLMMSSTYHRIESLILEGDRDGTILDLSENLFLPWESKTRLMNKFYFHQEGGLDLLIKVYGLLVSKEWGSLGIDREFHIYLERKCSLAVCNYGQTFPLRRQVLNLGGLEMCSRALLRRQLHKDDGTIETRVFANQSSAVFTLCNLSELPECQVLLAKRTDVIDQVLAIALHPACACLTAAVAVSMILCLTQSPETHNFITWRDVVGKMLEICELTQKKINEQSSLSRPIKEDPAVVKALKFYTTIVLAQVGLGSPHLLFDSIPPHIPQKILSLMSDTLEAASPAEIRLYEKEGEWVWWRFSPYLQYLYKPSPIKSSDRGDIKASLLSSCCNILLHRLESALGREVHIEILVKEGLVDYTMCLPAVLPGECKPRARSLVNELGKHRQLQPPSLCTLAKAHIAKTFCGLQPVVEMNSIGEFLHKFDLVHLTS